jgi:two-component system CheB/CheR fusion protein
MLKTSNTKEEFSEGFLDRLSAMGRTHDLLSHRNWEGADLRALIVAALMPYATADKGNIELAGPGVLLRPTAAAALGMVSRRRADTSRCRGRSRSMPKAGGSR